MSVQSRTMPARCVGCGNKIRCAIQAHACSFSRELGLRFDGTPHGERILRRLHALECQRSAGGRHIGGVEVVLEPKAVIPRGGKLRSLGPVPTHSQSKVHPIFLPNPWACGAQLKSESRRNAAL